MHELVALAVVATLQGVLLVHRADRTPPVAFPGGRVEPGEAPAAAAVRETLEETGLEVVAGAILASRVHPATGADLIYVRCTRSAPLADPAVTASAPREVTVAGWYSLGRTVELMPDMQPAVKEWLEEQLSAP